MVPARPHPWARKLCSLLVLCSALAVPDLSASIFLVNSPDDTPDAIPGDGHCADAFANCTLRAAVQEANALNDPDIIHLPAGTYVLTIPGNAEHAAATGDLDVLQPLEVIGAGADVTFIDGGGLDRIFETIHAGTVEIRNVTLRNGNAGQNTPGYFADRAGGAISNVGDTSTLILRNVVIRDNSARSGGGIHNIFSTLEIRDTTLHDNVATSGNGGALAEGLAAFSRLYNVTLSANRATGSGGGIFVSNNAPQLNNVTIVANTADSDANGSGDGGGIARGITGANLANTIIAANTDMGGEAPDCAGGHTSAGYNLIGNNKGCTIGPATGDQIGTELSPLSAGLGPLANNGGTTPTHAVLNGSPARHLGHPASPGSGGGACESRDQRGIDRGTNGPCDIGSYQSADSAGLQLTVNSAQDRADGLLGDGLCETVPGNNECTLRAAVQETNARVGNDVIEIPAGLYLLDLAGAGEDAAATGDLDVSDHLTIRGDGALSTIIDGNSLDRIFEVRMDGTLDLSGVTLRNGAATGNGGAIMHQANGSLSVSDCIITGNSANGASASGGGIFTVAFTNLNVDSCTISNNTAGAYGGGIANFTFSTATIVNSTLTANSAGSTGGGLMNSFMSNATITGSTFNDNESQQGGAIGTRWGNGTVTLVNTTISGNRGNLDGGGLFVAANDTLNLRNVTVTLNQALASANGGGIANYGSVISRNSLIAGNLDAGGEAPDCSGPLTSQGYNLIGDDTGCTIMATTGDQIGAGVTPIDARLAPLLSAGGATAVHSLLLTSPALNAANPQMPGSGGLSCEELDQQGVYRSLNAPCDIGAAELAMADLSIALKADINPVEPGSFASYTLMIDNQGPDAAHQLQLTLLLPHQSTFKGISNADWTCSAAGDIVTCLRETLADNAQSVLTVTAVAGLGSGNWATTAHVTAASFDTDTTNNSVTLNQTINSPPQLFTSAELVFSEVPNGLPVASSMRVADADDSYLVSATVGFVDGYRPEEDFLAFDDTGSIKGHWDSTTGELNLSGHASVSAYQHALRSVRYLNLETRPSAGLRVLGFSASDNDTASATVTTLLEIPTSGPTGGGIQVPTASPGTTEDPAPEPVPADGAPVGENAASENSPSLIQATPGERPGTEANSATESLGESATSTDHSARFKTVGTSAATANGSITGASLPDSDDEHSEAVLPSVDNSALWAALDDMKHTMQQSKRQPVMSQALIIEVAHTAGVFLAAGVTNWYVKSSTLLASMLSTLPLWTPFDPLPILALSRRERKRRKARADAARDAEARSNQNLSRLLDTPAERSRT